MSDMIHFELEQTKEEKERSGLRLSKKNFSQRVAIFRNGEKVGHIFTPSGSGENITNAIQICGFKGALRWVLEDE